VDLFIATTHRGYDGSYRVMGMEKCRKSLLSYAYRVNEQYIVQVWDRESIIIADSGAFTAFSRGEPIRPEEYLDWAISLRHRWAAHVRRLEFMSLDVIGDQEASWRNYFFLKTQGLDCIPIVTYGVDLSHITKALNLSRRIALGGLVPLALHRTKLQAWLDACFAVVGEWSRKNHNQMPHVHLLGISTKWCLYRYPCASADSSSWDSVIRFGNLNGAKLGLPDVMPGCGSEMQLTEAVLRLRLRETIELEKQVTAHWERQGIIFTEEHQGHHGHNK